MIERSSPAYTPGMHRVAILVAVLAGLPVSTALAQDYVELDATSASAGRSLGAALRVLAATRESVRACGVAPAVRHAAPPLVGSSFAIGIGRDGHVASVRIELPEAARDAGWLTCVETALRRARFARARAATSITGTVRFASLTAESLLARQAPTATTAGSIEGSDPGCSREERAVVDAEVRLRRARADAARAPLQARLTAAEQALSACRTRSVADVRGPAPDYPVDPCVNGRVIFEDGGAIGSDGDLDESAVAGQFRARMRAYLACYERRLRLEPYLAGRVTVELVIAPGGAVTEANVPVNTTGDTELAACVTSIVRALRFDPGPTGGPVRFRYPLRFGPRD